MPCVLGVPVASGIAGRGADSSATGGTVPLVRNNARPAGKETVAGDRGIGRTG